METCPCWGRRSDTCGRVLASQPLRFRPPEDNLGTQISDSVDTDLDWLQGVDPLHIVEARLGRREVVANCVPQPATAQQGAANRAAMDQAFAAMAGDPDQASDVRNDD